MYIPIRFRSCCTVLLEIIRTTSSLVIESYFHVSLHFYNWSIYPDIRIQVWSIWIWNQTPLYDCHAWEITHLVKLFDFCLPKVISAKSDSSRVINVFQRLRFWPINVGLPRKKWSGQSWFIMLSRLVMFFPFKKWSKPAI